MEDKSVKTDADKQRECRLRNKDLLSKEDKSVEDKSGKSNANKQREYRLREKLRASKYNEENAEDAIEISVVNHTYVPPSKSDADDEFHKRFVTNKFGFSCSVSNRLWFERDLRPTPSSASDLLAREFPNENYANIKRVKTATANHAKAKFHVCRDQTASGIRQCRGTFLRSIQYPNDLSRPYFHLCRFVICGS